MTQNVQGQGNSAETAFHLWGFQIFYFKLELTGTGCSLQSYTSTSTGIPDRAIQLGECPHHILSGFKSSHNFEKWKPNTMFSVVWTWDLNPYCYRISAKLIPLSYQTITSKFMIWKVLMTWTKWFSYYVMFWIVKLNICTTDHLCLSTTLTHGRELEIMYTQGHLYN